MLSDDDIDCDDDAFDVTRLYDEFPRATKHLKHEENVDNGGQVPSAPDEGDVLHAAKHTGIQER